MAERTRQERRFLRRLKRRDEAAFGELVEQHKAMVFAVTYRMLGNVEDAEDVAQEVFVSVFKGLSSFRNDSNLRTWIYRIALNHSRNRLRARARRGWGTHDRVDDDTMDEAYDASPASVQGDPVRAAERRETAAHVRRGLDGLPEGSRELLIWRDLEGRSYEDIAEMLDVPIGTVKSRIYRARAALRGSMKDRDVL